MKFALHHYQLCVPLRLLTNSILIRFQEHQDESGYENRFRSRTSDFGLFRYLKSIVKFNSQISYRALQFGMSEQ
jgi:hypothetical protein